MRRVFVLIGIAAVMFGLTPSSATESSPVRLQAAQNKFLPGDFNVAGHPELDELPLQKGDVVIFVNYDLPTNQLSAGGQTLNYPDTSSRADSVGKCAASTGFSCKNREGVHRVVATTLDAGGDPIFDSGDAAGDFETWGAPAAVNGTENLATGTGGADKLYSFRCLYGWQAQLQDMYGVTPGNRLYRASMASMSGRIRVRQSIP